MFKRPLPEVNKAVNCKVSKNFFMNNFYYDNNPDCKKLVVVLNTSFADL